MVKLAFHRTKWHRESAWPSGTYERCHGRGPSGRQCTQPAGRTNPEAPGRVRGPTPRSAPHTGGRPGPPASAPGGMERAGGRSGPAAGQRCPPGRGGAVRPRGPEEALPSNIGCGPRASPPPAWLPRARRGAGTTGLITINHPRTRGGENGRRPAGGAGHGPSRTGRPGPVLRRPPLPHVRQYPPVSTRPAPGTKFGCRPCPPALPARAERLRRCQGRDKRHTDT